MGDIRKSLFAAGGVALAAGSVVLGATLRNRVDVGGVTKVAGTGSVLRSLVASRDNRTDVPEGDFFHEIAVLLRREYVEPIPDETKLASGAVRGMISSLSDAESRYMDKEEFAAYLESRQGKYQGIGAEFEVVLKSLNGSTAAVIPGDQETVEGRSIKIPELVVAAVTPGGPADKAGVQPGDVVDTVDGRWVVNAELVARVRKAQQDFDAKKVGIEQINALRKEFHDKTERSLMPLRARQKLSLGTSGETTVIWRRGAKTLTTRMTKAASTMPGFAAQGDVITLPFVKGSAEALRKAIEGKTAVTLDLRNNLLGDIDEMRECLAVLAPEGTYGSLVTQRGGKPIALGRAEPTTPAGSPVEPGSPAEPGSAAENPPAAGSTKVLVPLVVSKEGNARPPAITLLVDRTTRGPAEILALALSSKGLATLKGGPTGGDVSVLQIVALPDGSGYTLRTAEYSPKILKGGASS